MAMVADRTALLLMDLQHAALASISEADGLLGRVGRVRRAALAAGVAVVHVRVAVVHVRVAFTPDEHAAVPGHHRVFAAIAERGYLAEGSHEVDIHPDVRPGPGEHVVTKTRTGAMATTGLDGFLRERGIDTLILAGIYTSGVVLSTASDAADRDYRLLVLADAYAYADPDTELHARLLATVMARHAQITDTDNAIAALARA
jgi:nicotinamidase-related amidase